MPDIIGYRTLSEAEIALMNEGKELAVQVGAFVERLKADAYTDKRWVALGATSLQTGFMQALRGVARPETF